MIGKTKHYFAGGNTAKGFYSLFESNLQELERLYILKGGPGTGKSTLMKKIGKEWVDKGFDIQLMHCASDPDSIDGVIITELKVGIVDGTAPHVIEPKAPGAIEEYINLGTAWDSAMLSQNKQEILKLTSDINSAFEEAYSLFASALAVHDEWEEIYITNLDFQKVNKLTDKLKDSFFDNLFINKKSEIKHRFLGAATPIGAVDFVQNLTEDIAKRYFLKGRPGSGKSTMLKKLAIEAEQRGFDVEIYHCGFDPNSIDMVIVREIGVAIFDSTAPHEYFPIRQGDEIVDIYQEAILPGTDEVYSDQIEDISTRYRTKMKEATQALARAKSLHDNLEEIYIRHMDFSVIDRIYNRIRDEVNQIAEPLI